MALPAAYPLLATAGNASDKKINLETSHSEPFLIRDFSNGKLELVRLLKEITEVEHSLMLQYLYTGFSLKPEYAALAGRGTPDSHSFIGVAVQEMQHLGSINRLLVQLGSKPNMGIQDFPYESDIYPFAMDLEPMSRHSVAKYAYCESPPDRVSIERMGVTDPFVSDISHTLGAQQPINHVGSVYQVVVDLFERTMSSEKNSGIDKDYWLEELRRIMDEGEDEHFSFFKSVFMGTHPNLKSVERWWDLDKDSAQYPSYNCLINPSAFLGHNNEISNNDYLSMAWLGNLYYWTVLVLLDFYYRHGSEEIKYMAISNMLTPLKSIGTELAKNGYGLPFDQLSLGYSPCLNGSDNLMFAVHLLHEAKRTSAQIKHILPADYPESFEIKTADVISRYAETWRKSHVHSVSQKTFMSVV